MRDITDILDGLLKSLHNSEELMLQYGFKNNNIFCRYSDSDKWILSYFNDDVELKEEIQRIVGFHEDLNEIINGPKK